MQQKGIPIISLFCGAGGLDLGFRKEGFAPVLAIDSDEAAVATYNHNSEDEVAVRADLARIRYKTLVTLLTDRAPAVSPRGIIGGPPCQGFSRGNARSDPGDPRNTLPLKYARFLARLNGDYGIDFFVFENVPGLKSERHLPQFIKIRRAFEDAGFRVFETELNAKAFAVPQNRARLFLVGINKERFPDVNLTFPVGVNREVTVRNRIEGLPNPVFFQRNLGPENIPYHPNHWAMNPKSKKFTEGTYNTGRSFRQLKWDEPSRTVAYGNREVHVHPAGGRRLSVLEAMLLQGFPRGFQMCGTLSSQFELVSNAVPPALARPIAKMVRQTLYPGLGTGNIGHRR